MPNVPTRHKCYLFIDSSVVRQFKKANRAQKMPPGRQKAVAKMRITKAGRDALAAES
jgi:hypothetical protein